MARGHGGAAGLPGHHAGGRRPAVMIVVATAAMRDADNGAAAPGAPRRELGIEVETIDGDREARYGFVGGGARPAGGRDGLAFDIGGGSMQVSPLPWPARWRSDWSLPLGAPAPVADVPGERPAQGRRECAGSKAHVRAHAAGARASPPCGGEDSGGHRGGTVRNLAKIDRRARGYPIMRLHGYTIGSGTCTRRWRAPDRDAAQAHSTGLSDDRGDSIVGGALGIETRAADGRRRLHPGLWARACARASRTRRWRAHDVGRDPGPARAGVRADRLASPGLGRNRRTRRAGWRNAAQLVVCGCRRPRRCRSWPRRPEHASRVLDIGRSVDFSTATSMRLSSCSATTRWTDSLAPRDRAVVRHPGARPARGSPTCAR